MEPRLQFLQAGIGTAAPSEIGGALLIVGAFLSEGKLVLTTSAAQIDAEFDGDTWFPCFDESKFIKTTDEAVDGEIPYKYVTYTRL